MKATKEEVDYSRGMRDRHCGKLDMSDLGFCANFVERGQREGSCTEVQGVIGRGMWCTKFTPGAGKENGP